MISLDQKEFAEADGYNLTELENPPDITDLVYRPKRFRKIFGNQVLVLWKGISYRTILKFFVSFNDYNFNRFFSPSYLYR